MERRLTTIVAADIAGYSRLVGADEDATLATQRTYRAELIDPMIEEYGGRIANTAGDSLLIEFPSAIQAVRCAVAVQDGIESRNADVPEDRRILYRVGINIGDVVAEGVGDDADLLGDGVNIAARLEALAPPGEIVVSRNVRDQVRDRDEVVLADLGEFEVKNIARPVRAFQVLREDETPMSVRRPRRRREVWAVAVLVLIACLVGGGYWFSQRPDFTPANAANFAYPLPDKPSIAVLAFDNLSGDTAQEFLSDGLSENIISALAGNPGLFVISSNSSFSYKGKSIDIRVISEELGVQYILDGSVERHGDRLRVTVQLIDAVGGHHVWVKTFDNEVSDIFLLKDRIVHEIARALHGRIVDDFMGWDGQRTMRFDSWIALLEIVDTRGKATLGGIGRSLQLTEEAIAKDPQSPDLYEAHGWNYLFGIRANFFADRAEAINKTKHLARRAIELDPNYAGGFNILARAHALNREYDKAIEFGEKAVSLAPSISLSVANLGLIYRDAMRPNDAIDSIIRAKRLNPKHHGWYSTSLAEAYRMTGQNEKAIAEARSAISRGVSGYIAAFTYMTLSAANDALDRKSEAAAAFALAQEAFPSLSAKFLRKFLNFKDPAYTEAWISCLKKYGLPEE